MDFHDLELPELTPKSLITLREIYESDSLTHSDVVDKTHLDGHTVGNAIQELKSESLIESIPSPADPRKNRYSSRVLPRVYLIAPDKVVHPQRMSVHPNRDCGALKGAVSQRDTSADELIVSMTKQEARKQGYHVCQKCENGETGGAKSELEQMIDSGEIQTV